MDDEERKPSKNMLNFIRVLLSRSMGDERAKSLPDNEIAWIAPLAEHELGKLASRDALIVILRYGLSTCRPLDYKEIAEVINRPKGVTRDQAVKVVAHAVKRLSIAIKRMNEDEYNLFELLSGEKSALPVLYVTNQTPDMLENIIERLKRIQLKYNVQLFIFKKFKEAPDEQIPE